MHLVDGVSWVAISPLFVRLLDVLKDGAPLDQEEAARDGDVERGHGPRDDEEGGPEAAGAPQMHARHRCEDLRRDISG